MRTPLEILDDVNQKIARAAERSGRKAPAVTFMAVTKTIPIEKVTPFLEAGVGHVGENRVQEALNKYSTLNKRPALHLIGQLQTNKAKKAVGFFDVIQSVDRLELAEAINRHAQTAGKKQACLIEVKISSEESKSGLAPDQLFEFLEQVITLPYLEIRGLMGIPPLDSAPEAARPYFRQLRSLFDKAASDIGRRTPFNVLSMGMSQDYEIAIEEGSTMVRLGSLLFGKCV